MSQTLTYVIGQDRRAHVDDVQNFKVNFDGGNSNWVQARQYERSLRQVFVNIKNEDGTPFDLTGCNVWFEGLLPKNSNGDFRIIDDKGYVALDPSAGRFRFDMPGHAFTVAGSYRQAFFRIIKDSNSVTTLEFDLDVLADKVIDGLVPRTYISPVEELIDEIETKYQDSTDKLTKMTSDFVDKFTQTMKTLQALGTTVQSDLDALEQKIKTDGLFTQAEADAFKQAVTDKLATLDSIYEHTYPTLADLQADKTITAGKSLKTGGYYTLGDGGGAIYDIVDTKPGSYYETLQNGLYAKLRYTPKVINVAQWGVSPSKEDNYEKIQMIFDKYGQGATIYFPNGIYKFSKTLVLSTTFNRLTGDPQTLFEKNASNESGYSCTFNNQVYDFSKQDVAMIIGPANQEITSQYHHSVELNEINFVSTKANDGTRQDRGLIAVGTAYMKLVHCSLHGYMENFKQYVSFGFNASQTESTGARTSAWVFCSSVHVQLVDCASESLSPIYFSLAAYDKSSVHLTNTVITMNAIQSDNSNVYANNCSFETNANTLTATAGGTLIVSNSDIEHHQDPACKGKALVYCTDGSTVIVDDSKWRWANYSGDPTWDSLSAYTTNAGCRIVVTHCQFEKDFPTFTHYDGGADYVVWDQDFDIYKKHTAQITPADGVTILGETLQRDYNGQCFLNVGFTVTKDLGYMASLFSFPPSFRPWDGCYIQFLQQKEKNTYQAFTNSGQIKVYDTVPAGTQAILTFSYQAQD